MEVLRAVGDPGEHLMQVNRHTAVLSCQNRPYQPILCSLHETLSALSHVYTEEGTRTVLLRQTC